MEKETDNMRTFDMDTLKINLPQKRGLSRYYSGKSRSFKRMADVEFVEDLEKEERPKKRKKHSSPLSCRGVSSSTQCASPIFGV
ncbi:hypothetical protein RHGRI_013523 [Rhododendron griersonianum]|uniref:Uncharacterized protein n=1 Tax=Rhododendron griersonianum TaxID=479676 RepID=A0AAV6K609_9ERIC|nr:hypothetical protein RHGRI_013523 [Rhododendron griersonianum]